MPPFFPEHGVLAAQADEPTMHNNSKNIGIQPRTIKVRTVQLPFRVVAG
jgi:hypothetical protein